MNKCRYSRQDHFKSMLDKYSATKSTNALRERPNEGEICAICLEKDSNTVLKCKHVFHKDCIEGWINVCNRAGNTARCPYCNSTLEIEEIAYTLDECHKHIIINAAMEKFKQFEADWNNNPDNKHKNMPNFNHLVYRHWTKAIQENIQKLSEKSSC